MNARPLPDHPLQYRGRRSLTGDLTTDRLVDIAQLLVCSIRELDCVGIDLAFDAAKEIVGERADPAKALAIVLAAMVPDAARPSELLAWWSRHPANGWRATASSTGG